MQQNCRRFEENPFIDDSDPPQPSTSPKSPIWRFVRNNKKTIVVFSIMFAGIVLIIYATTGYKASAFGNPSLEVIPFSSDGSQLIWLRGVASGGHHSDWRYWLNNLNNFLTPYKELALNYSENVNNSLKCDDHYQTIGHYYYCLFSVSDGCITEPTCSQAKNYGYDRGYPCVAIKLNSDIDWTLVANRLSNSADRVESNSSIVERNIADQSENKSLSLECVGENAADKELIGPVSYVPKQRIPYRYLNSFTHMKSYLAPFVFVHFGKPATGAALFIVCTVFSTDTNLNASTVRFQLLID